MVKKTTQTPKVDKPEGNASQRSPEVVVIESQVMMTDLNMHRSKFEELPMGMYRVQYVCPYYVLNMMVSWDGERIV
jgi:hypothetical protein